MPEVDARAIMHEKGLEPIEPHSCRGKPWRSRHTCGRLVSPTLSNIRTGHSICRYCNSNSPYDGPAALYLIADLNSVKIGIASPHLRRLTNHRRFEWSLAWTVDVGTGDNAYNLEQANISWWSDELDAQPAYEAGDLR